MKHSKIPLSQTIVQLCKAKGIEHIVISPGSRNAPLTIGFTYDNYFKCYSIVDERCAAFFALGIIQKVNKPVAVICTSGSALLNYYPAVAEAFYSDLPLVIISADRPKYLIGIGDGQTINQKNVFSNHVLYYAGLKQDINDTIKDDEELPIFKSFENKLEKVLGLKKNIQQQNELEINKALNLAFEFNGPVQINAPFEEPLYELAENLTVNPNNIDPVASLNSVGVLSEFTDKWNQSSKKMVLVGVNRPNSVEQKYLDILQEDESVVIFTETTSNLQGNNIFPSIDKIIAPLSDSELKELQPEILLTFGGLVVSKKIKAFLRCFQPKEHWHIDEKKANDTFFCLSKHFKSKPNDFFKQFLSEVKSEKSEYRNFWLNVKNYRNKKHLEYLKNIPYSDFLVFNKILNTLPSSSNVHFGNSSAIRYAQLFDLDASLKVYCNRGTSGIDGSTSTAIGYSCVSENQTILITGDLSFFYDSNALWNAFIPNSFRIIMVNNNGGGIFRILPGHKNTDNFDTYFETKHQLTAEQLCKMYNFKYTKTENEVELQNVLEQFYKESSKPQLLEILTPRTLNDSILLDYFKFIK